MSELIYCIAYGLLFGAYGLLFGVAIGKLFHLF
jgi:hypothetical protein